MLKVPEPIARAVPGVRAAEPRQRYYAFLSYSHKDKETAAWLQRELERFRVPAALVGQLTANGSIPRKLTPIFRDEHELGAARELSEEISAAIASSQFLIVICSPAAAASRWTNAEVAAFKRSRPDGCVLAAIIDGEPFASDMPGREAEECFPPALRHKFDRRGRQTARRAEPLAADLRVSGDGRRTGVLKLVAGLLGVGLDQLVQREATQRHRRLAWLTSASLAGMALASGLAITAIQARDAARDQRREAEGLVAFMLGDLKDKLEPIGRLDALDGVGSRVLAYYSKQDTSSLSDAALLQRSRALSLTAQVAYLRGQMATATRLYGQALAGTAEAVERNPEDPQRLFDHAQNVFWTGAIARERGDLKQGEAAFRQYKRLARRMVALDPDNMNYRMEEQYADVNLGIVLQEQRRFAEAASQLQSAVQTIQALSTANPGNADYKRSLAETLAWLADARFWQGQPRQAIAIREQQVALLDRLRAESQDTQYQQLLIPAEQALGLLYSGSGNAELGARHYRAGIATADKLLAVEKNNTVWLDYAFEIRLAFADALLASGRGSEARAQTAAGCAMVQSLLARDPAYPNWRSGLSECERLRAQIAAAGGSRDEALAAARRAVTAAAAVKSSDRIADRFMRAASYRVLGDVQLQRGDRAASQAAWSRALAELPPRASERPLELVERATILARLGRAAEAEPVRARLAAMKFRTANT